MDLNNYYIFTILIALIGFVAGRISHTFGKQTKILDVPSDYFKGIDFLLNNQEDEALEEFINAAKINSRNAEIYLTLGNIYRNKGEYEKAIRIHQSILLQADIDVETKKRALLNLSKNFCRAGFYKRAIETLNRLENIDANNKHLIFEKIKLYILVKNWEYAIKYYKKISKELSDFHINNFSSIYVEMAKEYISEEKFLKGKFFLKKSLKINPTNPYAYAILGNYYYKKNNFIKAQTYYKLSLTEEPFVVFNFKLKINKVFEKKELTLNNYLLDIYFQTRNYIKNNENDNALKLLKNEIIKYPNSEFLKNLYLIVLFIKNKDFNEAKKLRSNLYFTFKCKYCNIEIRKFQWQCPNCKNWLTIKNTNI